LLRETENPTTVMSPTHITVGVAAAAVAVQAQTLEGVLAAVVGGSVGGLICDVDVRTGKLRRDTFVCRVVVAALALVALYVDWKYNAGIWDAITERAVPSQLAGVALFGATCVAGALAGHRSFAHSLLAIALWSAGLHLVCEPLVVPFAAGALSHVALDLLNKKPVRLLFPVKHGFCLGLCRADGLVDKLLCAVGTLCAVVALAWPFVSKLAGE
jgi:inner membrane protein